MAFFIPSPMNSVIRDELLRRISFATGEWTTGELVNERNDWNARVPWVKFTSNAIVNGNLAGDGFDYSLMGGVLYQDDAGRLRGGFDEIYGQSGVPGDTNSFRPMAGVTGIDVDVKGGSSLGAIRIATVNWVCWDKEQLSFYELLFMSPGISCVLEWGWSSNRGSGYIASPDDYRNFFENKEFLKQKINASAGTYDAMFGIIKNFGYTVRDDGAFDCTTELIAPAITTWSMPTNAQLDNSSAEKTLIANLTDKLTEWIEFKSSDDQELENGLFKNWRFAGSSVNVKLGRAELTRGENVTYIVWWAFEQLLNDILATQDITLPDNTKIRWFDSSDTILFNHPFLRSTNHQVCLLPGNPDSILDFNDFGLISDTVESYQGKLYNVLVSTEMIKQEFSGAETVVDGIKAVLKRVNDACLDVWDFDFVVSEDKIHSVQIIDKIHNNADFKVTRENIRDINKTFEFPVYSADSIVKDIGQQTKIPNALQQTMAMAAMAPQALLFDVDGSEAYKGFYSNVTDRFFSVSDAAIDRFEKSREEEYKAANLVYYRWLDHDFSDEVKEIALLRKMITTDPSADNDYLTNRLIPFDMDVTIDGISGIYYGNAFTSTYLPDRYKNKCLFVVTGVKHTVSDSTWDTILTGRMKIDNTDLVHTQQGSTGSVVPNESLLDDYKTYWIVDGGKIQKETAVSSRAGSQYWIVRSTSDGGWKIDARDAMGIGTKAGKPLDDPLPADRTGDTRARSIAPSAAE